MRICPTCKTAYPARGFQSTCSRDGTPLVDAASFAADQSDPMIGTTLAGRFKIMARIGTGGMGTVYRAEQQGLSRQVALKVLKQDLVLERETVARFQREAKAMSLLLHTNTVRVFDFGEDPATGHLFLAMELLTGELLTALLDREGALDPAHAIDIAQQILRSLHEAHTKGIVHRDLKPDNIYLAQIEGHPKAVVKVLDFGIAKAFREENQIDQLQTQAGTVFGTPRYMSPEQAQGKALDPRSDLYSVGVLLYQLLCGRPPFVDDDAVVVMAKHIRDKPDPLRKAAPDRPIPASLERIVHRALEKDPGARPGSGEELERALGECLGDVAAERAARASGALPAQPARRPLPPLPLAIGGAVILLALVVAGIVIASPGPSVASPPAVQVLPAPAPVAAAPPAPVPIQLRRVQIDSDPPGAELWRGGTRVGLAPQSFDLGPSEGGTVELRLAGHEPATVDLATALDTQTVTLQTVSLESAEHRTTRRVAPRPPEAPAAHPPAPAVETPRPPHGDPYERFD